MKKFEIPSLYKSDIIGQIKEIRRKRDKLKKDLSPSVLDFGPVQFLIARHFGFCYGVENAVEIAYRALDEHPNKRIFLLSEMIHNPEVNKDLLSRGVRFLMDTSGNELADWQNLNADDIVIVPAFGTTIEIQQKLEALGINPYAFDTTCPFVEKVWNRAAQIGERGYTVIIHGKPGHEETRATFSHSSSKSHSVVVKDLVEAKKLAAYMVKSQNPALFYEEFKGQYTVGFNPETDLEKIGVVNQTTMLASETQEIAEYLKTEILNYKKALPENAENYFANTRDTLCYATNDNQDATHALLENEADLAIIVGGYNSSNTSHLVELAEKVLPTYFIKNESEIKSKDLIAHYDLHQKQLVEKQNYLPSERKPRIALTCGASCPDAEMEKVLLKILSYFENTQAIENVINTI